MKQVVFFLILAWASNSLAQDGECPKYDFQCRAQNCVNDDLQCFAKAFWPAVEKYCSNVKHEFYFPLEVVTNEWISHEERAQIYENAPFYGNYLFTTPPNYTKVCWELDSRKFSYKNKKYYLTKLSYFGKEPRIVKSVNFFVTYSCDIEFNPEDLNDIKTVQNFWMYFDNEDFHP